MFNCQHLFSNNPLRENNLSKLLNFNRFCSGSLFCCFHNAATAERREKIMYLNECDVEYIEILHIKESLKYSSIIHDIRHKLYFVIISKKIILKIAQNFLYLRISSISVNKNQFASLLSLF